MMVSAEHEPKICPNCPRKSYLNMVRAQSYTTTPTIDPTVKICARLRALDLPSVPQCPYFSENEKITNFLTTKKKTYDLFRMIAGEMHRDYIRVYPKPSVFLIVVVDFCDEDANTHTSIEKTAFS